MEQKVSYNEAFRLFFHDEEYSYALELGCIIAPEYDYNEETDQLEFNGCYKAFDAFRRIINGGADIPFTYKEYLAEEDIQNGLKALAVDSLKFWNALVLLHHISDDKFNGSHSILPSAYDEVSEFIQYLDSEDSTIIARKKNGRKAEITDPEIIKSIRRYLEENIDEADFLSRRVDLKSSIYVCDSERISYEARNLIALFKSLASKNTPDGDTEYKRPMLLISRILKFSLMPDDEGMAISAEKIKDCLKKYPNAGKNSLGKYFIM